MTTNQQHTAEIIYAVEKDSEVGIVDVPAMVDRLAAAGVLADDLPAPSLYAYESQDPMWDTCNHFRADALDSPRVALSKAGNIWKMTPDEARDLALALLAAAAHAERNQK